MSDWKDPDKIAVLLNSVRGYIPFLERLKKSKTKSLKPVIEDIVAALRENFENFSFFAQMQMQIHADTAELIEKINDKNTAALSSLMTLYKDGFEGSLKLIEQMEARLAALEKKTKKKKRKK